MQDKTILSVNVFIAVFIICSVMLTGQISAQDPPNYRYVAITHHDTTLTFNGGDAEINELNQVAFRGLTIFRSGNYVLFDDDVPGTIWSYGHVSTFPNPNGYESRSGWRQLNNLGQVPGSMQLGASSPHIHGFIGTTSSLSELGILPKTHPPDQTWGECVYAQVTDISDNGMIVGVASEGDNFFLNKHAFPVIFENGEPSKIPHVDGLPDEETGYIFPLYVNNNGEIAGTNTFGNGRAFFGNRNSLTSIPHGNDSVQISEVTAISETGYVVGIIRGNFIHPYTGAWIQNQRHSYISYKGGVMIDLQALDSAEFIGWTAPYDVSSDGHVVGTSASGAGLLWWNTGSTWESYGLRDLITEGDNIPSTINGAVSINDNGVILAYTSQSGIRPCLLVPIESSTEICVNSSDDEPDASPGDGVCSTGETDVLGEEICTMRAAIEEANARPGLDTICFRVPENKVIYPQSELPNITDSVFINGLTQPGNLFVHINGSQQGSGRGIEVVGGFSTIRGLMLNEFATAGIVLNSGDSNVVENCWFGTDKDDNDLGNLEYGIYIENSNGNRIGTPGALEKANKIAFNGSAGIFIQSGEQNRIFTNQFFFNDGLGIDIAPAGVNDNDDDDVDTGPNTGLNHPVIEYIESGTLYGTFDGEPNETVTIELYRSDSADVSGYGEGQYPLLLTTNVNTDNNGVGQIALFLDGETLSGSESYSMLAHDNDNTSEFSPAWPDKKIRVADYLDNPIANQEFVMFSIDGPAPDFPETLIDTITTDADGFLFLTDYFESGDIGIGSVLKLTRKMDSLATVRSNPLNLLPNAIEWHLDNAKFDSTTYAMGYDTLDVSASQTILMNHTLVLFNMVVAIEWEVDNAYLYALEAGLRMGSNYLFDVSDGQMAIGKVHISDDMYNWERADLRILAQNTFQAEALQNGVRTAGNFHMFTGRQWYGNDSFGPDSTFFNVPLDPGAYINIAAIVHEMGHYYMNLGDEYKFKSPDDRCESKPKYGFMDDYYTEEHASSSEMSQVGSYSFAFCDNTLHYRTSGGKSCWQVVDSIFSQTIDGIPLPIFRPLERNLPSGDFYFKGPNDNLASPDYNIGALVEFTRLIFPNSSSTKTVMLTDTSNGLPLKYVVTDLIKTVKSADKRYQKQGRTSKVGGIHLLGAETGDSVKSFGQPQILINKNSNSVGEFSWFSTSFEIPASPDSFAINTSGINGAFPLLCDAVLDSNSATLNLTPLNVFSENPSVVIMRDSSLSAPMLIPLSNGEYTVQITDSLSSTGLFEIQAVDANSDTFYFPIDYAMYEINDTLVPQDIFSDGHDCSMNFDTALGGYSRLMVMSTEYPIMPGLLPSVSKQVSRAHSLSMYPNTDFSTESRLSISYSDYELNSDTTLYENELSVHIHKWNLASHTWDRLSTVVDTSYGSATASISGPGIYAAFTTDVNTDVIISNTNVLPTTYTLSQNYPNPFNPDTKIEFAIPAKSEVMLVIHNVLGQKVKVLVDTELSAGNHAVFWDGTDDSGHKVASGVYLYRFIAGDFSDTKKMVLLK